MAMLDMSRGPLAVRRLAPKKGGPDEDTSAANEKVHPCR